MRLPRRAILIRILIYGPLLGYFGWRAYERYATARDAERRAAERDAEIRRILDEQSQTVTLPDGTTKQIPVITPEQARKLWGIEVPAGHGEGGEAGAGSEGTVGTSDAPTTPGTDEPPTGTPSPDGADTPKAGHAPAAEGAPGVESGKDEAPVEGPPRAATSPPSP
ncbi:MAG: hypothetical protein D6705_06610 [Deltaproteobacteria bacterium]|nr:MAG: hypothetical protein D6705_06610 [Deltaproteobacteria bacterium]